MLRQEVPLLLWNSVASFAGLSCLYSVTKPKDWSGNCVFLVWPAKEELFMGICSWGAVPKNCIGMECHNPWVSGGETVTGSVIVSFQVLFSWGIWSIYYHLPVLML